MISHLDNHEVIRTITKLTYPVSPNVPVNCLVVPDGSFITWQDTPNEISVLSDLPKTIYDQHAVGSIVLGAAHYSSWRSLAENNVFRTSQVLDEADFYTLVESKNKRIAQKLAGFAITSVPVALIVDFLDTFAGVPPGLEVTALATTVVPSFPGLYRKASDLRKKLYNNSILVNAPALNSKYTTSTEVLDAMQKKLFQVGRQVFLLSDLAQQIPKDVRFIESIGHLSTREKFDYLHQSRVQKRIINLFRNAIKTQPIQQKTVV